MIRDGEFLMKRKFLLALMVSCLCFPFTAYATNYLNDDPYFPQTGGRMATREYTDLTSIYIREETEKYIDLEVGCVFTWGEPYRIRRFRYWKEDGKRPQLFNQMKEIWADIPKQPNAAEAEAFRRNTPNYNIGLYMATFKTNLFHCLKAVLHHTFGIEIEE